MNAILVVLLGIAVAPVFSKLEIFDGPCPTPDVDVIKNFNQTQFEGFWYIIERYEDYEFNLCSRLNYLWSNKDREFMEILKQLQETTELPRIQYVQSFLTEKELFSNNGRYLHRYSLFRFQDYHFVDTDYSNYAVLWICRPRGRRNEQNLIVMARDRFFDINSMGSLNATLAKQPFDRSLLKRIDQGHSVCDD